MSARATGGVNRGERVLAAALVAAAIGLGPLASPALGTPPSDPVCVVSGIGTTGLLLVGGALPTPDELAGQAGGFGPPAPPEVAASLPERVVFRTRRETFGEFHAFALRDGNIYVRRAEEGRSPAGTGWHQLELPACLAGKVRAISADHHLLLALGDEGQIYSHDMPDGDISPERWTWRWGPYFWTGSGMRMPVDVRQWATSEFTSAESFTDMSGRSQHPIGVATVYLLRGNGRITYIDPWLPNDESRAVCTPRRNTTPLAGLSGSGSTVFAVSRRGELFTRLYDFDSSGANTFLGTYSWEQGRPPDDRRWQLPAPGWIRHRRPPGLVTDRVSISKSGPDASDRVLRIAGRKRAGGRSGYWEKSIGARGRQAWRFVSIGGPLAGKRLHSRAFRPVTEPDDRRYSGSVAEAPAVVPDFNPECSPARLRVHVAPGRRLDLILHSSDALRQEPRGPGLDDSPREYNGAIEIPLRTFRRLDEADPRVRAWVEEHLDGRFTTAPLAVTETRMRFLAQCWELTLNGAPARPDKAVIPPDIAAVFLRFTESLEDEHDQLPC